MRSTGSRLSDILGAVLVGGRSSRFGSDKSEAEYRGEKLLHRALRTVRDAGATHLAYVGGPARDDLDELVQHVADDAAHETCMLRGIVAALGHAARIGADRALIVACDVPLLRAESGKAVLLALGELHDVAVARGNEDHWSCVAMRTGMLAPLRGALERGERAVHRAIEGAVSGARLARVVVDEHELTNVNDVATLRAITDAAAPHG